MSAAVCPFGTGQGGRAHDVVAHDRGVGRGGASAGESSRWRRSRPGPPPPRRPVRGERTRRSPSASRARGAPETPTPRRVGGPFPSTRGTQPRPAPASTPPGADGPAGNSPRLQALDRRVGCLPRVGVWARSPGRWYLWGRCLPRAGVWGRRRRNRPGRPQMSPPRGGVGCAMRIRRTHRVSSRYLPHIGHIRGYASHTFRRWR